MKHLIVLACFVTLWGHAEDGVFLRDSAGNVKASMADQEVVVRFPVTKTTPPKARCILLVDSQPDSHLTRTPEGFLPFGLFLTNIQSVATHECSIHVILDKPSVKEQPSVVVLGDQVFWDVHVSRTPEPWTGGWITLPVATGQKAARSLRDAGRLFVVEEEHLFDVRLTDEERAKPAMVEGQLSEQDIEEIRQTVYAMARQQILEGLASYSPDEWAELLKKWPGRQALKINSREQRAAVYYAPGAGYQMEKIDGRWMIVGG